MFREEKNMFPLIKLLKDENFKFPSLYMPEIQETGTDIFIQGKEVDLQPDGVMDIFWGIADKNGKLVELGDQWIQYLPHGFLIRMHAPQKNLSPEMLEIDYIIDMDHVNLCECTIPQADWDKTKLSMVYSISIENGIYTNPDGQKIHIDERLVGFSDIKTRTMLFREFVTHR